MRRSTSTVHQRWFVYAPSPTAVTILRSAHQPTTARHTSLISNEGGNTPYARVNSFLDAIKMAKDMEYTIRMCEQRITISGCKCFACEHAPRVLIAKKPANDAMTHMEWDFSHDEKIVMIYHRSIARKTAANVSLTLRGYQRGY